MAFIPPLSLSNSRFTHSPHLACRASTSRPSLPIISPSPKVSSSVIITALQHTTTTSTNLYDQYVSKVDSYRKVLSETHAFRHISNAPKDDPLALAFLLYLCARGVRMTEFVESWWTNGAQRSRALGMQDLAETLQHVAEEEKGHHLMYERDTHSLAQRWNERFPNATVDPDRLLNRRYLNPGEQDYYAFHEAIIASDKLYHLMVFSYEIELLSVSILPNFLGDVVRVLGKDVLNDLTFLTFHRDEDIQHNQEGTRVLKNLLRTHPHEVDDIAQVGIRALTTFTRFLDDCFVLASNLVVASMDS